MQGKRTRRTPLLQRRPAKTIRSPAPAFSLARVPAIRLVAEPGPGCYIRSCSRCAQCVVVICRHLYFCGDSPSFIVCGASPDSFGRFAQDASPLFLFGLVLFPRVENEWCHVGNEWCPTGAAHFFRDEAASRRASRRRAQHPAWAAPRRGRSTSRASTAGDLNGSRPPGSRFEPFLFSARRRGCQRRAGQRAARAAQN